MRTLPKPSSKPYSSRRASGVCFGRTLHGGWNVAGSVASAKSYQRKDAKNDVPPEDPGNATVDFHGQKRSNQTHESKTDPDAKMHAKAREEANELQRNLLVENRHGLIVNTEVFEANGTAERDAGWI